MHYRIGVKCERNNWTLLSFFGVSHSRQLSGCIGQLDEVIGIYNATMHTTTTGVTIYMRRHRLSDTVFLDPFRDCLETIRVTSLTL